MMNKKTLIAIAVASAVGLSAIGAATFANDIGGEKWDRGFGMMGHGDHGPRWFGAMFGGPEDQNDPAQQALLSGDYAAFVAAIKDAPFAQDITQEQFTKMSDKAKQQQALHDAIKNNDYAAYATIVKAEYEERSSQAFFNDIVAKEKTMTAVKTAFDAKDYTAYVAAVKGTDQENKLTEAQFTEIANHNDQKGERGQRGEHKWDKMGLDIKGLLSGDYAAFTKAIAGTKLEGKITQDQFNSLVAKFQQKTQN